MLLSVKHGYYFNYLIFSLSQYCTLLIIDEIFCCSCRSQCIHWSSQWPDWSSKQDDCYTVSRNGYSVEWILKICWPGHAIICILVFLKSTQSVLFSESSETSAAWESRWFWSWWSFFNLRKTVHVLSTQVIQRHCASLDRKHPLCSSFAPVDVSLSAIADTLNRVCR